MKRGLTILSFLCLSASLTFGKDFSSLDSLLTRFYDALEQESLEVKTAEFDSMIGLCADSLTRQHVAIQIFEHYKEPRLMGDEDVAFHIYDRWFADAAIAFPGDMYKLEAELYIEFNRQNLIGCQAPVLTLFDPKGKSVTVPEKGLTSILYFFDTACGKCKLESKVLPGILKQVGNRTNFYAVFSGQDVKAWKKFRKEFKVKNKNIRIIHLEDREISSDYLRKYGVLSTPRLFVVESGGLITGRRLEAENLLQALRIAEEIQSSYEKEALTQH